MSGARTAVIVGFFQAFRLLFGSLQEILNISSEWLQLYNEESRQQRGRQFLILLLVAKN